MARRSHEEHEEHMDETWLIPYSDLLTLLLALFIVLYAASNLDKEKYAAIAVAFNKEIPVKSEEFVIPYSDELLDDLEAAATEQEQLQELQKIVRQVLEEAGLADQVTTEIDTRGLVISMNNALLFDPGSAEIKQEYQGILVKIGETLNRLDNFIRVEGHTDTVPTNSELYPTNWELSSARAINVVRLFQEQARIDAGKLMGVAYGEYKPIADNLTPEGREKNRRVDVILLSSRFDSLEGNKIQ